MVAERSKLTRLALAAAIAIPVTFLTHGASAIVVTGDTNAASLVSALLSGSPGLTVTG